MAEARRPLEEILFGGPGSGEPDGADLAEVFSAWYRAARARLAREGSGQRPSTARSGGHAQSPPAGPGKGGR